MRRDLLILAAALLALITALVVTAATLAARTTDLRGYADATRSADLPFWQPRLGVNADLRLYQGEALTRTLDQMRALNMTWVRQTVPWSSVEREPGQYDWSVWDTAFAPFASDPQLRLVAVLQSAPAWAVDLGTPLPITAPPVEPDDYAQFAAAFASRYGAFIDHYQVWDEPNLGAAWGGLEPQPAEYLALLAAAYEAIHAADARAVVLAAALAPTVETGPQNLSDVIFLDELLTLGGGDYLDAVAGKPFGFDRSAADRTADPNVLNFSRLVLLRETLARHGLGKLPLWASAWGWNSLPADWPGTPSIWGAVTAEEQAAFSLGALERAEREWPWLGGMALFTWQPDAPPADPLWGFALMASDGSPTALYEALAARQAQTAAANGLYAAANPFARYSGEWRFGPLGADIGQQQDSQAIFRFAGRDVALLLREDDFVAYLFAAIDGQPTNALPADGAGNTYAILTSDTRVPTLGLTTVARGLSEEPHELRLIADRGWDRWTLAGYAVSSADLARPYDLQVAVALVTSGVAILAAGVTLVRFDWGAAGFGVARVWAALGSVGQLLLSGVASFALMVGLLLSAGGALPELLRREPAALGLSAGAALVLYVSPPLIVAVGAALILFLIFFHRADLGLILVVFFSPFYLFPVELYRFAFPMAELVLLLLAAAWASRLVVGWARRRGEAPQPVAGSRSWSIALLDLCVMAYLALGAAALISSSQRGPAVTELRVLFVEPALFYLILRAQPRPRELLLRVVDALVLAGALVAVIGLAQYALGDSVIIAEGGSRRLASVYGSPNNAALFLERALPFAAILALTAFDRTHRLFGVISAGLMLAALALTLSAGALFLGVPASLALVLVLYFGRRGLAALGGLAVLLAGTLVVAMQSERFARLVDFSGGTSFFRVRVWQSAVQMIADHSITGIGLDQFLYLYRGQYIAPDAWQEPDLSHPHNILLDFWLRLGVLGALLLILMQAAFWMRSLRLWHTASSHEPVTSALVIGAMGSMAAVLTHGLVDNSVFVNDLAIVLMLLLAIPSSLSVARGSDTAPAS